MTRAALATLLLLALAAGAGVTVVAGSPPEAAAAAPPSKAPRVYWVYLAPDPDRAAAPVALTERAARRLAKVGHRPGEAASDHDLTDAQLAPLIERGIAMRQRSRWLEAVSAVLTAEQARELARDPRVRGVRPVTRFVRPVEPADVAVPPPQPVGPGQAGGTRERHAPAPPQSGADIDPALLEGADYGYAWEQLEMLGVPELHARGWGGAGVLVAIFDTGFLRAHESLGFLSIAGQRDFVCGDDDPGYDPNDPCDQRLARVEDPLAHGTYTWSAAAGFAPSILIGPAYRASFLLARTEDVAQEVHQEEDNYIAALEWADSLGADLVSTSLGYRDFDGGEEYPIEDLDGDTIPITLAADQAADRGMLVVTAMGNEGPEAQSLICPADGQRVLSVGACDFAGGVVRFSSRGPTGDGRTKPDLMALGLSTFCASSIDLDSYARVSGTSLATPLMAGLAALLLEARPDWTPDSLLARLRDSGDRSSQPNSDEGWGVPDGLRALRSRAARLQTLRLVWQEEGAGDGHPGWEEHGTLGVWLANVGPTASEQALLSIESHDEELAITGDEVVAVGPIAPGDSVLVPSLARVVLPERPEGVALGEFRIFLGIEEGGIEVDRALLLTVGRPYALTRFEATPDPTGSVTISWDLDVDASYFGQNALHGFHLYRIHGQDSERLDGVLIDRGVRRWLDRPGAPGSYSYVLELQFRNGVLRYQEGPVVANVAMPGRSLLGKPYPNPATGTLTIPLVSLSEAAQRIEIFTATGRRVRTIEWNAPVGYGLLDWDAKDDGGRDVPSGLYILKQSGGSTARVWVVR